MSFELGLLDWLMKGDISVQYQMQRDLLERERKDLQVRIENEGWGASFLAQRHPKGHWGRGFYQPKWISSHYTLLDLKTLQMSPSNKPTRESIAIIVECQKGGDGGINPSGSINKSDVCINGMFLNYACYFL